MLPFFNIIWQRFTFSKTKPLVCGHCGSIISVQGGASIWTSLVIGSTGGYLLGKLLGGFSIEVIVISVVVGSVIFIISSYLTAPIRDAQKSYNKAIKNRPRNMAWTRYRSPFIAALGIK